MPCPCDLQQYDRTLGPAKAPIEDGAHSNVEGGVDKMGVSQWLRTVTSRGWAAGSMESGREEV